MRLVSVFFFVFLLDFGAGRPFGGKFTTREHQENFLRDRGFDNCNDDDGDVSVPTTPVPEGFDPVAYQGDVVDSDGTEWDDETFREAVKCFQKSKGLPETGIVDDETRQEMINSEEEIDQEPWGSTSTGSRRKRYVLMSQRWNKRHLTYFIQNYNVNHELSKMTNEQLRQRIQEAFKMWTDVANITVSELNSTDADIVIGFYSGDHNCPGGLKFVPMGGQLGHAFPPGPQYYGDLHFNADEKFKFVTNPSFDAGRNFLLVAVHEVGHTLGIAHSASWKAIMYNGYPISVPAVIRLNADDIAAIQAIYGPRITS